MNISDEAVEAACAAFYNDPSGLTSWDRAVRVSPKMADRYRDAMTRALEAAAPHLMAAAWEAGATEQARCYGMDKDTGANPYRSTK